MSDLPRCPAGHPMPRYTVVECDAGHEHRLHTCGALIGSAACGADRMVPDLGPGCDEDDESEER